MGDRDQASEIGRNKMPKWDRDNVEVGTFLRRFERVGKAQKWMDADLLRHLPLSLEKGAEDWYCRLNPLPQTWTELKDLMPSRFRSSRFLEQTENSLKSRTLRWGESISEYHDAILALFFELEVLGKAYTDQEKADQLTEGLHGEMLRDVTLMAPANPPEFLAAAEKAVRISRSTERKKKNRGGGQLLGPDTLERVERKYAIVLPKIMGQK
ncbi:hypothetical protein BV898_15835 [Hypsibius exemplaris]|uniref:Retrotransposon gag domain-containing protein n=1 Tax=Hypsibius exemplaris TaxID=2072580 RepID=A0A9X6RKQ6_HYPEX|nr:hypothetical protein BV898_15835 [Hypsibius exemplaris]